MTRNFGVLAPALATIAFVAYACTEGEVVQGPVGAPGTAGVTNPGTAGTTGNGGTTGAAGSFGLTGGTGGSSQGRGGNTGATAGTTTSRGGNTGATAGTTTSRGGNTGTGNTAGSTSGVAGNTGTSGTGGSSTSACGSPSWAVAANGYVQAPMPGGTCWHGYAFAGKGMMDTGSSITPMDFAACGTPCNLTMMGTVGAATMANNYAGVAFVGFNVNQDSTGGTPGTIVPTGTGVTVTFTATTGGLPLRAQIGAGSSLWCYTITGASPVTIPWASFNTACWEPTTGTAYGMQPIQSFQMVVPGGAAATTGVSVTLSKAN